MKRIDERDFLAFAAEILGVPAASLSPETTYGSIPEWDSMAHLRLVVEAASRFGVEIPFADVVRVTSLWEFLRRLNGDPVKKAVAVDLDNTLWRGVAGEDGPEALRHDLALQRQLRDLRMRGVLLVALSKNNPEDVAWFFEDGKPADGSRGLLAAEDFIARRLDWNAKPDNLASVAAELGLGPDAFVFVDDNPAERLEMRLRMPSVTVAAFPPVLAAYFPERPLTDEDRRKTEEYRAEAARKRLAATLAPSGRLDPAVLFRRLGVRLDLHPLTEDEVPRVAQLSQKANQFNVRTHRRSEEDVRRLAREGLVVTAHARDDFGDQGLVAYAIVRNGELTDWVMSCRAAGRDLEPRLEAAVERIVAARGGRVLTASWRDSGRNRPVRDLFDRLGFTLTAETPDERRYIKEIRP